MQKPVQDCFSAQAARMHKQLITFLDCLMGLALWPQMDAESVSMYLS